MLLVEVQAAGMIGYPFLPIFTRFLRVGQANMHLYPFPPVPYPNPLLIQKEAFGWKKGRPNGHLFRDLNEERSMAN
jgi:hypothetical protein